MSSRFSYIRTETLISVCINTVLSLGFVLLVFHGQARIPVMGAHGIVLDMAPQTFMVTLMGCLIPGLLTRSRFQSGRLPWLDRPTAIGLMQVIFTAVLAAVLATLVVVVVCRTLLPYLLPSGASFVSLVLVKAVYGALLACVVTPWAIMRLTRRQANGTA